jgi:uncharacterized protein YkwD
MSRRTLLLALALLASMVLAASTHARAPARRPVAASAGHGPFGGALLRELNRVRARYHLAAVRLDARMSHEAHAHSRDMVLRRYFGHGSWSGRVARAARCVSSIG